MCKIVVLICISPMTYDVEYFFVFHLYVFFGESIHQMGVYLLTGLFIFLLLSFTECLWGQLPISGDMDLAHYLKGGRRFKTKPTFGEIWFSLNQR